jgi:hypothetical protein
VIKVRLNSHLLDPVGRTSNLFATVFREMAKDKKTSTVIEVDCGRNVKPLRLQLRLLQDRKPKGASRQKSRPAMTRKS